MQKPDFTRLKEDSLIVAKGAAWTAVILICLFWLAVLCDAIP